jgi:nucleoside-diphosphate-sugar epimerase
MVPARAERDEPMMKNADDVVRADLDLITERAGAELDRMAGKSLLIVGGAGFLGHYLVQSIAHHNRSAPADRRIALTVFDNYSRGVPTWLSSLSGRDDVVIRKHDITAPLPEDMADFDYVVHAASIASPTYYRLHPIETMDANVMGLRRLLDHALEQKRRGKPLSGFLFFSTSEIYGDPTPENIPTKETYRGNVSCTGPRACYDESKRYGETLSVAYAQVHGLPIRTARPFNNYGPGLGIDDRRVLPDYARDVLAGRDIVMLSDGSPTRTFCYVADAVVGYYKILVSGRDGEAYNIGTPAPEISVLTLAEKVIEAARELFGYQGKVVRKTSEDAAYLVDNPNRRCPDIAKARAELGFEPVVGLEDGLRRSLLWYRGQASAGRE